MDNNKVGHFIAKLRKKKGLTQDELGNMLGISGKSVSKWERGLNMPDISLIYKLSEVFDVDLNQLLNGEDAIKSVVDLQNEENAVNTLKIESDDKLPKRVKKKSKKRLKFKVILISLLIVLCIVIVIIWFDSMKDNYALESATDGFAVEGKLTIKDDGYSIYISDFSCYFDKCFNEKINTVQYSLAVNDVILFRSGILDYASKKEKITLEDYLKNIIIDVRDVHKFYNVRKEYILNDANLMCVHLELSWENGETKNYDINLQIADKK